MLNNLTAKKMNAILINKLKLIFLTVLEEIGGKFLA